MNLLKKIKEWFFPNKVTQFQLIVRKAKQEKIDKNTKKYNKLNEQQKLSLNMNYNFSGLFGMDMDNDDINVDNANLLLFVPKNEAEKNFLKNFNQILISENERYYESICLNKALTSYKEFREEVDFIDNEKEFNNKTEYLNKIKEKINNKKVYSEAMTEHIVNELEKDLSQNKGNK